MDCETFRESLPKFKQVCENYKDKPILMYCTGGIRCTKAGAYLKSNGCNDVRMVHWNHNTKLRGGITNYGRYVKNSGIDSLFIGKNYTFDDRKGERVTSEVIGKCKICKIPHDEYHNCAVESCNELILQCDKCREDLKHTCSPRCKEIMESEDLREAFKSLGSSFIKNTKLINL